MRYDLVSLALFVSVAEEQNLTRAARRRHIAVSAVSKRIAELEQLAATPLLLRLPRGIELTPAGHALLFHARRVLRNLEAMEEELGDYASGVRGHIRIQTISAALTHGLPQAIARFLSLYPQTDIEIEECTGVGVVQGLMEGQADVGILSSWTAAAGLQLSPWQQDRLAVLVWQGHPLQEKTSLRLADLLSQPLIAPHRESAVSHILEREARKRAATLQVVLRISSFAAMPELVSQRLGIAILPVKEIASPVAGSGVRLLALDEPWAARELLVGIKDPALASPSVKTLLEHLTGGNRRESPLSQSDQAG